MAWKGIKPLVDARVWILVAVGGGCPGTVRPVLSALEALLPVSGETEPDPTPVRSHQAAALVTNNAPIRRARTCYAVGA